MAQDRADDAVAILAKYHGEGRADHPVVRLQLLEMSEQIATDASDKRWYDYSELWSSRGNRYRTFLVISIACIGEC